MLVLGFRFLPVSFALTGGGAKQGIALTECWGGQVP